MGKNQVAANSVASPTNNPDTPTPAVNKMRFGRSSLTWSYATPTSIDLEPSSRVILLRSLFRVRQPSVTTDAYDTISMTPSVSRVKTLKSVEILLIINCLFFLCWLPIVIFTIVLSYIDVSDVVAGAITLMAVANSAVNVFVYAWKSIEFRSAYVRLLTCSTPRGDND